MSAVPFISEWLPSGAVIGFGLFLFMLLRGDMKAMEERLNKRIDHLQGDVKEIRKDVNDLPLKIMEMLRKAPP